MEVGFVEKIIDEKVYINVRPSSSCNSCSSKAVCFGKTSPLPLCISNENLGLQEGDIINFEYHAQMRVLMSLYLFIMPLLVLILVYILVYYIFSSENIAILGSLLSLFLSFGILKLLNNYFKGKQELKPLNIRVIGSKYQKCKES